MCLANSTCKSPIQRKTFVHLVAHTTNVHLSVTGDRLSECTFVTVYGPIFKWIFTFMAPFLVVAEGSGGWSDGGLVAGIEIDEIAMGAGCLTVARSGCIGIAGKGVGCSLDCCRIGTEAVRKADCYCNCHTSASKLGTCSHI